MIVCAGRGTAALARGVGLDLPVREASHVRLTFPVRGEPPERLPCLQHPDGAYGDPYPGNDRYAIGLGDVADPAELAASAERTRRWVAETLPGLVPEPVDVRHCWVTELPVGPGRRGGLGAGRARFVAGGNLFKHAPWIGRALARKTCARSSRRSISLGERQPPLGRAAAAFAIPSHGSPRASSRAGTSRSLNRCGVRSGSESSSQARGVATGAPGLARTA